MAPSPASPSGPQLFLRPRLRDKIIKRAELVGEEVDEEILGMADYVEGMTR